MDTERKKIAIAMTETDAADVLGVSIRTLQSWRQRSIGPTYMRLGGAIRYRMSDLETFLAQCVIIPALSSANK